jgi:hypothetical protein
MTTNQAVLDAERRAREHSDYDRHLAAEIVAMLPPNRAETRQVLAFVDAILSLTPK